MIRTNLVPVGGSADRKALRPAIAAAMMIAACAVFEPPLAGTDASVRPDSGTGGSLANGGSAGTNSGSGGQSASGGQSGSGGSAAESGSGGSASGRGGSSGTSDAGDGSAGSGGNLPLGPWWRTKTPDGCDTERQPTSADRPDVPDGPSLPPITLAQSRLLTGGSKDDADFTFDENAWMDMGFDIDKACTSSPTCNAGDAPINEPSCKGTVDSALDGNLCRDNALGSLVPIGRQSPIIGGWFAVNELHWNCALHRGEAGGIFRITNYNGTPYDPAVRLDMYQSVGTQNLPIWSCLNPDFTLNPDWKNQAPWPATRHWKIARRSIALNAPDVSPQLPNAKVADPAAFVRGGYLFASLPPNTEIWLHAQRAHMIGLRQLLQRPILVGRLHRTTEGWFLDDTIITGTVLPSDEMLGFREMGFCENMCGSYEALREFFNLARDVLSSTPEKLPDVECDALSLAFRINARPATADVTDLFDADEPVECPQPRHPEAPRQGCICNPNGGPCLLPDGGS